MMNSIFFLYLQSLFISSKKTNKKKNVLLTDLKPLNVSVVLNLILIMIPRIIPKQKGLHKQPKTV